MILTADHSGNKEKAGKATRSVGSVRVDAARWTRRGGNRGRVGGVLPAVSLQSDKEGSGTEMKTDDQFLTLIG